MSLLDRVTGKTVKGIAVRANGIEPEVEVQFTDGSWLGLTVTMQRPVVEGAFGASQQSEPETETISYARPH